MVEGGRGGGCGRPNLPEAKMQPLRALAQLGDMVAEYGSGCCSSAPTMR